MYITLCLFIVLFGVFGSQIMYLAHNLATLLARCVCVGGGFEGFDGAQTSGVVYFHATFTMIAICVVVLVNSRP